jgi:hypothetical protein
MQKETTAKNKCRTKKQRKSRMQKETTAKKKNKERKIMESVLKVGYHLPLIAIPKSVPKKNPYFKKFILTLVLAKINVKMNFLK